jgi:predicted kinase
MKPIFKMMIGIPSSGKSTYCETLKEQGFIIHSSDSLRIELYGDVNTFDKNDKLFEELHRRIKQDLMDGKNVCYDATNISAKRRIHFLQNVINKVDCNKIAVVIAKPYNDCVRDDKLREKKVGHSVIYRMYTGFNFPALWEGWDDVEIVYTNEIHETIDERLAQIDLIHQNNSNHTQTIGNHCRSVAHKLNFNDELMCAGMFHDIAKHKVASFMNSKGEITEQCHYYGHENCSAYDTMFLAEPLLIQAKLSVLALVQYHMKPHLLKEDEQIEKFKKQCGEDFWNKLMLLHEADKESR